MHSCSTNHRQSICMLLVISLLFSVWSGSFAVLSAESSSRSIRSIFKSIYEKNGPLLMSLVGGITGALIGGGPIGMVIGAASGYSLYSAMFKNFKLRDFAMVVGAVAGAALTFGMGPLMIAGIIGGGLVGKLANSFIARFVRSGRRQRFEEANQVDHAVAARESAVAAEFIAGMSSNAGADNGRAGAASPSSTESITGEPGGDAQAAYSRYVEAFQKYTAAAREGNAALAQAAHAEYRRYLDLYNRMIQNP